MSTNLSRWKAFFQSLQQCNQSLLLRLRSCVFSRVSILAHTADVAHPNAMLVVSYTVSTHLLDATSAFDGAVQEYHVMITDAAEVERRLAMTAVDVGGIEVRPFRRGTAMNDDCINLREILGISGTRILDSVAVSMFFSIVIVILIVGQLTLDVAELRVDIHIDTECATRIYEALSGEHQHRVGDFARRRHDESRDGEADTSHQHGDGGIHLQVFT